MNIDLRNTLIEWIDWKTEIYPPQPVLIVRRRDEIEKIGMFNGCELQINVQLDKKYCIGFFDEFDNVYPCKNNMTVERSLQCEECLSNDILWRCAMCKGVYCINPKARDFCFNHKHIVYLAVYNPNLVKVGVSWEKRFQKRIAEQGANIAVKVAECPTGFDARKLERKITQRLGITDRSSSKDKQSALQPTYSAEMMTALIYKIRTGIFRAFNGTEYEKNLIKDSGIYDLYTPFKNTLAKENVSAVVIQDKKNINRMLEGKIVAQKGFYLLLKVYTGVIFPSIVAIDLRNYIGFRTIGGSIKCQI